MSASQTDRSTLLDSRTDSYDRNAWLKSCKYLRRLLGSFAFISRSTPTSACNCAALRRDRKLAVLAIVGSLDAFLLDIAFMTPCLDLSHPPSLSSTFRGNYRLASLEPTCPTNRRRTSPSPLPAPAARFFCANSCSLERDPRVKVVNFIASDSA